jgi:hypothetical protein
MLVHSHCEGAPVRPLAPPPSTSTPAIKLGLVHLDF